MHFSRGISLKENRNYSEAAREFKAALESNPSWVEAATEAAKALAMAGPAQRTEAAALLVTAWTRREKSTRPNDIRDRRELERTLVVITETFAMNQTFQLWQDAKNLLEEQKPKPALDKIETALKEEDSNVRSLILAGRIQVALYELPKAAEYYSRAEALNPLDNGLRREYGTVLFQIGRYADAETRLARIPELLRTEDDTVLVARSMFLQGKNEPGIELLVRDTEKHPTNIESIFVLGKIHFEGTRNYWLARKYFMGYKKHCETMKKTKNNPQYLQARDHLQEIEKKLGL
jgi:Tfp pilus assembly protein PilF